MMSFAPSAFTTQNAFSRASINSAPDRGGSTYTSIAPSPPTCSASVATSSSEPLLGVLFDHDDEIRLRRGLDLGADAEVEPDVGGERREPATVDVLEHERVHAAAHDVRNGRRDLVDRRERHEDRRAVLRPWIDLENGLGHDRERSLRTDDELGQVVSGRRLHELPAGADHVAVREHGLETEHLVAGDAVLHRAHPARVRRDVAAERGAVLARAHRVDETERRQRGVELIEADAGLDDGDVVVGVDLDDLVHALEREHDAVGARRAGAGQSGARAPRRDRHPQLVTDAHDRGDLGGRSGPHDGEGSHRSGRQGLVVRVVVCRSRRRAGCGAARAPPTAALPDLPSGLCRRPRRRRSSPRRPCRSWSSLPTRVAVGSASGHQCERTGMAPWTSLRDRQAGTRR